MKKIKWIEELFMQKKSVTFSQSWFGKIKTKEEAIYAINDLGLTLMFFGFAGALISFLFVSALPTGVFPAFFFSCLLTLILGFMLIVSKSWFLAIIILLLQLANFISLFGEQLSSEQLSSGSHRLGISLCMVYLSYRAIVGTYKLKELKKQPKIEKTIQKPTQSK